MLLREQPAKSSIKYASHNTDLTCQQMLHVLQGCSHFSILRQTQLDAINIIAQNADKKIRILCM